MTTTNFINRGATESESVINPLCEESLLIKKSKLGGYIGDQARTQLVKNHYNWILLRCRQTLRNDVESCDAAQEVALKMFNALPSFKQQSSLHTWLNTIIYNECMNIVRKRQRTIISDHIRELIDIHLQQTLYLDNSDDEVIETVRKVLQTLPEKNREILSLRFFGDYSLEEISLILNLNLSATKMRLYRSIERFKTKYELSLLFC